MYFYHFASPISLVFYLFFVLVTAPTRCLTRDVGGAAIVKNVRPADPRSQRGLVKVGFMKLLLVTFIKWCNGEQNITSIWRGKERSCKGTRELPEITSYTEVVAKVHAPFNCNIPEIQHRRPFRKRVLEEDEAMGSPDINRLVVSHFTISWTSHLRRELLAGVGRRQRP